MKDNLRKDCTISSSTNLSSKEQELGDLEHEPQSCKKKTKQLIAQFFLSLFSNLLSRMLAIKLAPHLINLLDEFA